MSTVVMSLKLIMLISERNSLPWGMCLACTCKHQQCASQNYLSKMWKQLTSRNLPKQLFWYQDRPPGRIKFLCSRYLWQIFPTNFSKQCRHQLMCNISFTKVAIGCSFDFIVSNHRPNPDMGLWFPAAYLGGLTLPLHILDFHSLCNSCFCS